MKKPTIRSYLLILVLSSLSFLVACGTNELAQEDALSELEAIAAEGGDIETTLSIQLKPKANLNAEQLPEADVEWVYFTGTTPKGKAIEGIVILLPDNKLGNFEIQDVKVRGKVTKLDNNKLFSGFYTDDNNALGAIWVMIPGISLDTPNDETITATFEAKAEFATRNGSTMMVARAANGIMIGPIFDNREFTEGIGKEDVTLELAAEVDGFIAQAETAITLDNGIKFNASVVGILSCSKISALQECTISKS